MKWVMYKAHVQVQIYIPHTLFLILGLGIACEGFVPLSHNSQQLTSFLNTGHIIRVASSEYMIFITSLPKYAYFGQAPFSSCCNPDHIKILTQNGSWQLKKHICTFGLISCHKWAMLSARRCVFTYNNDNRTFFRHWRKGSCILKSMI